MSKEEIEKEVTQDDDEAEIKEEQPKLKDEEILGI